MTITTTILDKCINILNLIIYYYNNNVDHIDQHIIRLSIKLIFDKYFPIINNQYINLNINISYLAIQLLSNKPNDQDLSRFIYNKIILYYINILDQNKPNNDVTTKILDLLSQLLLINNQSQQKYINIINILLQYQHIFDLNHFLKKIYQLIQYNSCYFINISSSLKLYLINIIDNKMFKNNSTITNINLMIDIIKYIKNHCNQDVHIKNLSSFIQLNMNNSIIFNNIIELLIYIKDIKLLKINLINYIHNQQYPLKNKLKIIDIIYHYFNKANIIDQFLIQSILNNNTNIKDYLIYIKYIQAILYNIQYIHNPIHNQLIIQALNNNNTNNETLIINNMLSIAILIHQHYDQTLYTIYHNKLNQIKSKKYYHIIIQNIKNINIYNTLQLYQDKNKT